MSAVQPGEPSKSAILVMVTRRSGPHLLEATVIPAVLFYACFVVVGLGAAYAAAVGWSYAVFVRRIVRHEAIPPILVLGVIGVTLRTIIAVLSDSSFVYFFQPVLASAAIGVALLISVAIGRPLIAFVAGEFWPLTSEEAARPRVHQLFRRLTVLWAGVSLASALLTTGLLVSLPVGAFLALKQVCGLGLTAAAVCLTVSMSLRTARREGLLSRPGPLPILVCPVPEALAN
ncbi:MAG TPA: VC0807 family protein [Acidimicrobiia bacterium]|nr:VC0807 family protein [Acidimicrobiia bacterium]